MKSGEFQQGVVKGLINARHTGATWAPRDFDAELTIEDAYSIQKQVAMALGWFDSGRPSLWKAGGSPPMATPLPEVLCNGANWSGAGQNSLGLEAELAFRLDKTPARPEDIENCIGSVCVCIELVATRLTGGMKAPLAWRVADQQMHAGLVIGEECGFAIRDWQEQRCRVTVNGENHFEVKGTHPTGNPLGALPWLVNHAAYYFGGLRAGDLITTGAWIVLPATIGNTFDVRFEGIGEVKVNIVP